MTTTRRLLTLLSLLVSRPAWTTVALADDYGAEPAQVDRDVEALRELGYSVLETIGSEPGYAFDRLAEFPIPVAERHGVDEGAASVAAAGQPDETSSDEVLQNVLVLGAAIQTSHSVSFEYGVVSESGGGTRARHADPHFVVTWHGRWYLVAWDVDREAWSAFRVDRIALDESLGLRFTPRPLPGGVDVTTFMLARFRGDDSDVEWPCRGEVVVGLPADEVRPYVGDGVAESVSPSRTRVTLGSWTWAGLAASLLRFDAELEVIGPPELADAFRELGVHGIRMVGDGDGPGWSETV